MGDWGHGRVSCNDPGARAGTGRAETPHPRYGQSLAGLSGGLADLWFFETLVRLHRAGENAPYTGLKPSGADFGPAVRAGDKALQEGSAEAVIGLVRQQVEDGIRLRFAKALEARKHAEHSAESGRQFVRAYVEFMHYVEALSASASGTAHHDAAPAYTPKEHGPATRSSEHSESHHK